MEDWKDAVNGGSFGVNPTITSGTLNADMIEIEADERIDDEQRAGLLIDYLKELRELNRLDICIPVDIMIDRISRTCDAIENILEVRK
ncbi:hypothetical protein GCM10007416_00650 [Kroppenstedtia guangzhouensis]|uniref:Uncharacterized protein n=1 Tax=Kroppenstedtia guangzhouensis TaxID=1274356 RepID=A0ABQ1FWQ4_9BACL|nr:hypothetical protein [Kroppenstedtia guangzhouensis]GGA31969.1 hypothetical protein GCM10007416_00650 [Kroppenstedtia guangzhouensis]